MLHIKDKAPNFTLPSTSGKTFTLYKDMLLKPCILYFYPKDFTPVCTEQACGFRDTFDLLRELDVQVIGISRDDIETHLRFREEFKLPFELLSDADGTVGKSYDLVLKDMPFFTRRTTYLLDKHHAIAGAYENLFSTGLNLKEIVGKLKH